MFLNELVMYGLLKGLSEGNRRHEICFIDTGVVNRIGTEFFDPNRADRQPFTCDGSYEVKAFSNRITDGIRQPQTYFLRLSKDSLHRAHQLIHGEVWLIDEVIDMDSRLKGYAVFDEGSNIFYVSHGFSIFTTSYHHKFTRCNLSK